MFTASIISLAGVGYVPNVSITYIHTFYTHGISEWFLYDSTVAS